MLVDADVMNCSGMLASEYKRGVTSRVSERDLLLFLPSPNWLELVMSILESTSFVSTMPAKSELKAMDPAVLLVTVRPASLYLVLPFITMS